MIQHSVQLTHAGVTGCCDKARSDQGPPAASQNSPVQGICTAARLLMFAMLYNAGGQSARGYGP
jgi:hypothetical protein